MAELTLDIARKILDVALAKGIEKKLKPLVVTVLDARGCVKASAAQDGTSLLRSEIAHGKAYGALAMGMGSRALFQRAQEQAYFVGAVNALAQGRLVIFKGPLKDNHGKIAISAGRTIIAKDMSLDLMSYLVEGALGGCDGGVGRETRSVAVADLPRQ